jgi:hypothetical protein
LTSAVASATYTITPPAATPVFSKAAGTYTAAQSLTITDATAGAVIYYTLNGTTPTTASTKYSAAIPVAVSETIKAIAVATGHTNSAITSAAYVIESPAATPVFSKAAGTYTSAQSLTITDATTGAAIYYTTNGTTPTTASTKYSAAITVAASETVKAIAVATGHTNSAITSAAYVIETPAATPVFSKAAGTYTAAQSVTITDITASAAIYYTLNGTTPTTASTKYSAAITVAASETIKAIAVAAGHTNSALASAAYIIETPAATPTFSVAAGTYTTTQSVILKDTTTSATIYYTTNGTTPTTASTKYASTIPVSTSETIKAIAVATGYTTSTTASAAYTISSSAGGIAASPTSLSFPFAPINTSSAAEAVTFKNTLSNTVSSLSVSLTGASATAYSKTQTCGTTLAPGASCTVSLVFSPKTDGIFAATLQLTGTGVSTAVSLSGVCGDPTSIAPDANT